MHRTAPLTAPNEEPPLPPRATGIFLGLWMAVLLTLALFVVPTVFATCIPADVPAPSSTP